MLTPLLYVDIQQIRIFDKDICVWRGGGGTNVSEHADPLLESFCFFADLFLN